MVKELTINGFKVVIKTGDDPAMAQMTINGKNIPLTYSTTFKGWMVPHTTFSFYPDLEGLAAQMVYGNPSLVIGHGVDAEGHETGHEGGTGHNGDMGHDHGMDDGHG
jgi:hypothetical protein